MKQLIMGFAASFLIAAISFAQPTPQHDGPGPHQQFGNGREHHLPFNKLNLTDAQKQQLKQVNADFRQKMQTLNKNEDITVREQRAQRQSIAKAHKDAMMNILTLEQKNQLATMRQQGKQKHEEMEAKRLDKLKTTLGLSDDQVAKIKANQAATQAKIKAIMDNKTADQSAKREQFMALRKEMKDNIGSVLTPEQKAKMENMHKEHGKGFMHRNEKGNNQNKIK
jgi:Spy/CpxP family protein refolding chaperone